MESTMIRSGGSGLGIGSGKDGREPWLSTPPEAVRLGRLIAVSQPMREVLSQIAALSASDLPVLIEGGPGTGKSLAALTLCELGTWGRYPRLEIDLAGPGSPFDEGIHEVRALARRSRGTLVLESVEMLSPDRQRALVHLLDEISTPETGTRLRPISTSRRDLRAEVARGRFRADLYYRLRGALLRMPSLAERPEDLALLNAPNESSGRDVFARFEPNPAALAAEPPGDLREYRRRQERALVLEALEGVHWNVSAAARGLGLSRVGLSKKMKVLGLARPA
ncbi:MAG TPA: sigma 54-interacting transcriptional regulator [Thermoanaerobaculia bacterium]|jgi:DNA-binding NtrC family response regulator|nr:sigma 54-interacting transcriptional regulator [Thermoanaerobaculia bacterium]